MARLKIPGKKKGHSFDKLEKKVPILRIKKERIKPSKKKQEVIRPMVITLRRFREIFGDSDNEEEEFLGFRAEDVGLKAYRNLSPLRLCSPSQSKESPHPVRTLSRQSSIGSVPESPTKPKPAKEKKKWFGAVVEEGYAKQYKKRESYERKYSPLQIAKVKQRPARTNAHQDENKTRESNDCSKSKTFGQFRKMADRQKIVVVKTRPATIAQQLLAKAKEGRRLQIQRNQRTTLTSEQETKSGEKEIPVRSRSGRIVKPKKFDYDDFISPSRKAIKVESVETDRKQPVAQKRPREESEALPAAKKQWMSSLEVHLDKLDVDNQDLCSSHGSGSRTSSRSHSSDSDSKGHRVRLKNVTIPEDDDFKPFTIGRKKVRVKNLSFVPQEKYEKVVFPVRTDKKHKVRIKNATGFNNEKYENALFPEKDEQNENLEPEETTNHTQDNIIPEVIMPPSDDKEPQPKRTSKPPNSYVFKSKRLQELQVKKEVEDKENEDESKPLDLEDSVENHEEQNCKQNDALQHEMNNFDNSSVDSECKPGSVTLSRVRKKLSIDSDRESTVSSKSSVSSVNREKKKVKAKLQKQKRKVHELSESDKESVTSSKSGLSQSSERKKRKQSKLKTSQIRTRVQQLKKQDLQQTESSEDEESNLPLAVLQKELKENSPKKVVKIIKVMRKYKTKDGEVKTKVVKVIKKVKKIKTAVVPGKRRKKCGKCQGCQVLEDCGKCSHCRDKPKFGGPGRGKQICVKRKCLDPQPPKEFVEKSSRRVTSGKKENTDSSKSKAKADRPRKKAESSAKSTPTKQGGNTKTTIGSPAAKILPQTLRQVDDKPLIKLSWSDNSSEDDLWKTGFHICVTAGIPEVISELCFLCGSAGVEKMYYCNVCAEPFHGFCLDEEPVDELTWCCDNCSSCSVCGFQNNLLMCDQCQRGYHIECLGPNYPTEPEGEDNVWICARCVKCTICGQKTPGSSPEATWLHEFSHCFDCGQAWEKGNICPLCEKCYFDDDFDSKMMQCAKCDRWIHADCEGLSSDQYECLSELPDSIPYICKKCDDTSEATPKWYTELMEEMEAGFERILDQIMSSKAYHQLYKLFEEMQTDNGHPRNLKELEEKVKKQKYLTVGDFCTDLMIILRWIRNFVKDNVQLNRQRENLFFVFCRELSAMFPWHKISMEDVEFKEEQTVHLPPNGIVMDLPHDSWDHTYAMLLDKNSNSDVPEATSAGLSTQKQTNELVKDQKENLASNEESISNVKDVDDKTVHQFEGAVTLQEPLEIDSQADVQQKVSDNKSDKKEGLKEEKNAEKLQKTSKVFDARRCLLCGVAGEAQPSEQGRLLYSGVDEWVHINCGLWSAEVFEDDYGCLQNVQTAICRGKQMKCEHCGEPGATVGCCENRCPENYHFMCGRGAGAVFQDDKKVYCAEHCFRAIDDLIMKGDDFRVDRRVCVDMSKVRATKKSAKGVEPVTVKVLQGAMTVETLGNLSEASDTPNELFPVEYRSSRLYWSTKDPRKRTRYYFTVQQKEIAESPSTKEPEDRHNLEDIHKVIVHDEVRDIKPKEKRSLIRTPAFRDADGKESSPVLFDTTSNKVATKGVTKPNHISDNSSIIKIRKNYLLPAAVMPGGHQENVIKPRVYPTLAPKPTGSPISTSKFVNSQRTSSIMKPTRVCPGIALDSKTATHVVRPPMVFSGLPCTSLISANSSTFSPSNKSPSKPINIYPKPPSSLTTYPNFVVNKNSPCTHQSSKVFPSTSSVCRSSVSFQNKCFSMDVNSVKSTSDLRSSWSSLCPKSPYSSPQKMINNIKQQSSVIPSMLNVGYSSQVKHLDSSKSLTVPASEHSTKVDCGNVSTTADCSETPKKSRKPKSKISNLIKKSKEDKKCEDASNFIQFEHEIVSSGEVLSPEKNFPDLVGMVSKHDKSQVPDSSPEKLMVTFIITNDEGLQIEEESCRAAWKQVVDMVQSARTERNMKYIPFIGMDEMAMLGLRQESIVFLLEQLPGAHQLKRYNFKYNPPFEVSESTTKKIRINPHGCARAEVYNRVKRFRDIFSFLASPHRPPPPRLCDDYSEDAENFDTVNGPVFRRPACVDLPMPMRYRFLKENNFNKGTVAVYRSPIHGRGLFCLRNIDAGEMVIEYSGQLIRSGLTDKREKYYESKGIGCYMFRVDGTYVVDATTSGNCARFINHSCEPNCYSRVISVDGQKKIIIFASRSISRGEELTYDYKFPIEDEKLPCHCGSKRCRKYLN